MKATGFKRVEVTNPNTGEIIQKIRVRFDNYQEFNLLTDLTVEEIKAEREELLKQRDEKARLIEQLEAIRNGENNHMDSPV